MSNESASIQDIISSDYFNILTCPICDKLFEDPIVHSCGNSFCKECFKKCTWGCIKCMNINDDGDGTFYPNLVIQQQIENLTFICPNGCGKELKKREFSDHLLVCQKNGSSVAQFSKKEELKRAIKGTKIIKNSVNHIYKEYFIPYRAEPDGYKFTVTVGTNLSVISIGLGIQDQQGENHIFGYFLRTDKTYTKGKGKIYYNDLPKIDKLKKDDVIEFSFNLVDTLKFQINSNPQEYTIKINQKYSKKLLPCVVFYREGSVIID
jgi:hypothetical protein